MHTPHVAVLFSQPCAAAYWLRSNNTNLSVRMRMLRDVMFALGMHASVCSLCLRSCHVTEKHVMGARPIQCNAGKAM